jgi:hypothetical protein
MPIINRKLNELISASTAQQEAMRTLVSAISEASRGKDGLLLDLSKNPLIGIHLLGSEQSSNALVEQNTRLKHEVEEFKRKNKQHQEKVWHQLFGDMDQDLVLNRYSCVIDFSRWNDDASLVVPSRSVRRKCYRPSWTALLEGFGSGIC